jgi:hypothetical protein
MTHPDSTKQHDGHVSSPTDIVAAGPDESAAAPSHSPGAEATSELAGRRTPGGPATRRLWLCCSVAALLAAGLSWWVGEGRFATVEAQKVPGSVMGQPIMTATATTYRTAVVSTAARQNLIFGGLMGLAMGIAGGAAARDARRGLIAGMVGSVVGCASAAVIPLGVVPFHASHAEDFSSDLIPSLMMHGANWSVVGLSAGLALAVGARLRGPALAKCIVGGLLGAWLGAALFEVLGATLFAGDQTGEAVAATSHARLFARLVAAPCIATFIVAALPAQRGCPARATREVA